jgi:DNA repair protein RadC
MVHPGDVLRPAVQEGGGAIVVVHNHPSGIPDPSPEDKAITSRLVQAGDSLAIPLWDHLIVGEGRYFSFCEEGILGFAGGNY